MNLPVKQKHFLSFSRKLFLSVISLFLVFAICFIAYQYQREREYKVELLNTQLQDYNSRLYEQLNDSPAIEETTDKYIRDHALLPRASMIAEADKALRQRITPRTLQKIVGLIPDEWLDWDDTTLSPAELREAYAMFLTTRLANSNIFVKESINARQRLI